MVSERTEAVPTIHWSTVLSGSFVALGCWLFLLVLGSAIGGGTIGMWTAIYTLVAPVLALFLGGLVAARTLGSRTNGVLHGLVIWGFSMAIGLFFLAMPAAALLQMRSLELPHGYSWAIAGAILCSLIASVLGCTAVSRRATAFAGERREVRT